MLDVIVLIAMAVTAAAFAVGLIVQSGIAQIPALIAAAALYLVMAASYLMLARGARPTASSDRLNEVEAALEIIDKDLQRIDRVEDDVSRLDLLADRVERLDQALSEYAATAPIGGLGRGDQVSNEFDEVHAKIDAVRADLEGEAKNQREKITGDLRALESLIKQLSRELICGLLRRGTGAAAASASPAPVISRAPEPVVQKIEFEDEIEDEFEEAPGAGNRGRDPADACRRGGGGGDPRRRRAGGRRARGGRAGRGGGVETVIAPRVDDNEMLEIVSQAIEAGRVDLYLQPTVTLPDRRPRYFEALTRIRTKADELILPGSYLQRGRELGHDAADRQCAVGEERADAAAARA